MSLSRLYRKKPVDPTVSSGDTAAGAAERREFRRRPPAWLLPVTLVAAFVCLFAFVARERLVPALPVTASQAILLADIEAGIPASSSGDPAPENKATSDDFEGEPLFQAAGWFEPYPLPLRATALTDGVIDTVHVLEGEEVKAGQLLATLIDEDARLAVAAAESALLQVQSEHHMHLTQIPAVQARAAAILQRIKAAQATLAEREDAQRRLLKLSAGTVAEQELTQARLAVEAQEAEIAALQAEHEEALAQLQGVESENAVFEAKIAAAQTMLDERKLALERTRIVSPVDGVVLELAAAPGQKKMLAMDDPDSATIAVLFELGKLQARVDVPLADAEHLQLDQAVLVTTDFLPNKTFRGRVDRIVGSADLQRNTLQTKVRLLEVDSRLRPEMLCRAQFLATQNSEPGRQTDQTDAFARAIMVLESALNSPDGAAFAWVVEPAKGTAVKRPITLGSFRRDGYVAVREGVLAGEWVIHPPHEDLRPGQRVRIEKHLAP